MRNKLLVISYLLLLMVLFLTSCLSTYDMVNTAENISNINSAEMLSKDIKTVNILDSANNKACYSITRQISNKDFTIVSSEFISENTLFIIQKDVSNPEKQQYLLTTYDTEKLDVIKSLPVKMDNGMGYTFCKVDSNAIMLFDSNKGSVNLLDFSFNHIKDILLPSGYSDYKIALSSDYKRLLCITNERKGVEIYDTDNGMLIEKIDDIKLSEYNGTVYCTGAKFIDQSRVIMNLQTDEYEFCMALFDINSNELYPIVEGNMAISQTHNAFYLKNDITGVLNSRFKSLCDTFKLEETSGNIEALYSPISNRYELAENISFSNISQHKMIVDYSDDFSQFTLYILNPDNSEKYSIKVSNELEEFEPVNTQSDNILSQDGETIVLLTQGKSLYLIKNT